LQPPVSATADKVYFRDGDNKIRYLTPAGQTGDVTTVPGNASTVSFFSISPDDEKISVLVEDFTQASTIGLRLYVEDLNGGGHHAEIYSTTTPKAQSGTTLWPMGWHRGLLVLALIAACTNDPPRDARPTEWHVSSAATGDRVATIKGGCALSRWPSPAGVACVDRFGAVVSVYDWEATLTASMALVYTGDVWHSGVSPSGQNIFYTSREYSCDLCPANETAVNRSFRQSGGTWAQQTDTPPACLWIDDNHMLTRDAVIAVQQDNPTVPIYTKLTVRGSCAGRFPGTL
jgi:hypothetical protein